MTRCIVVLSLLFSAAKAPETQPNQDPGINHLTAEEQAAGFRLLFNGRDLSHWEHNGKPGSFTVKDGLLIGDREDPGELAYWLSTDQEYSDFELRLQYKIPKGGNSGIFIRAPRKGRTSKVGMEIQILDDGKKKGKPGSGSTAAIYQVVAPKSFAAKQAGEWNDLCILCDGDHVKVTLNGVVVTDASMDEYEQLKSRPRRGYIGLSAHTEPVQFRTIRLREITHSVNNKPASSEPG